MSLVVFILAGACACNCVPHLGAGLQGIPFPTPFARPRGVGESPPLVNFLWGASNLGAAVVLLRGRPLTVGLNPACFAFAGGALAIGIYLSLHFGRVRRGRVGHSAD